MGECFPHPLEYTAALEMIYDVDDIPIGEPMYESILGTEFSLFKYIEE